MNDQSRIYNWIAQFIEDYPKTHDIITRWKKPVVGVAAANDPLYEELKTIVGPTHALPSDLVPGAKSVIVAFVPFVENIPESNMMITEQGCCGRVCSIITDWELEPTPRPEEEFCLFKRDGSCGKCLVGLPCSFTNPSKGL